MGSTEFLFAWISESKKWSWWVGALVEWLKEETRNQKVVCSNPGTRYWMDIFTLICCKNCNACLKRRK